MKKICFICPSRNRLSKLEDLMDSYIENGGSSDLFIIYDHDDLEYKEFYNENSTRLNQGRVFFIENKINFNNAFLHIMNHYSLTKVDDYEMIGFLEDDCLIETKGFDQIISEQVENVIYTNDLLNTPKIVSLPVIRSEIIKKLGYYSPPEIKCLWGDYYWKLLGEETRSIKYLSNVVISHKHYSVLGEAKDQISIAVDSIGNKDYFAYKNNLNKFIKEIRSLNE